MFEENQTNQPTKDPEDIFAQAEKEVPKTPAEKEKEIYDFLEKKPSVIKKILTMVVGVAVIFGLGYGVYYGYTKFQQSRENGKEKIPSSAENINISEEKEIKIPVSPKDTDGDGLSDRDEIDFGTRTDMVDTDGDGLSDREEIKVYGTNALNPDTDGDGFLDGQEVRGGYNPNDPAKGAKLIDLETEIEKLNQ